MINKFFLILMLFSFFVIGAGIYEIAHPPFLKQQRIYPRGLPMPEIGTGWFPQTSTGTPMEWPQTTRSAQPSQSIENKLCLRFTNGDMICQ